MRLRIDSLELVGTQRSVEFRPGLNIITGPIASGKTTLIRLCKVLLGGSVSNLIPELSSVSALAGQLTIRETTASVLRPLVSTRNAPVQIVQENGFAIVPAMQAAPEEESYGSWLLRELGMPQLEVPTAPTKIDSDLSPLTINDYLLMCYLRQTDIDDEAFGSGEAFTNIKRRYVMRILYGSLDTSTARLYEELRHILRQIHALEFDQDTLATLLMDSPWENKSQLESQLALALRRRDELDKVAAIPETRNDERYLLAEKVKTLDIQIMEARQSIEQEERAIEQLRLLRSNLAAQSTRLSKAVIADNVLLEYDFVKCPRCGSPVLPERSSRDVCYLCQQTPPDPLTKDNAIGELRVIDSQLSETDELVSSHIRNITDLESTLARLQSRRDSISRELNFFMHSFVSDEASHLVSDATERVRISALVERLADYLNLFQRLDARKTDVGTLRQQEQSLRRQIEDAEPDARLVEERLTKLESTFNQILTTFGPPDLGGGPVTGEVDRKSFLPRVSGRTIPRISSQGFMVLVNVAFALAVQMTALELHQPLPSILLIDGLTQNIGHQGEDRDRVKKMYEQLIWISNNCGSELQLIVADNDVPRYAHDYVTLRLSDEDRFVPVSAYPTAGPL